jgi:hypothetical protein
VTPAARFLEYWLAIDARPIAKDALVAGFPAGKIGFHGKAGGELEAQAGVVLEAQMDTVAVAAGVGEEFDEFYDPSFGLGEHQVSRGSACCTGSAPESWRGFGLLFCGFWVG